MTYICIGIMGISFFQHLTIINMNFKHLLFTVIVGCLALCAIAGNDQKSDNVMTNNKTLVAYFSATGTTMEAATKLAKVANADLYEIVPSVPYTPADLNWQDKSSRSSVEMKDKSSRPAIANKVENMAQYDTVFVGYPIWWYVAPTIINTFYGIRDLSVSNPARRTFLVNLNWKFNEARSKYRGSGAGETMKYLRPSAPGANWVDPKNLNYMSEADIETWLKSL